MNQALPDHKNSNATLSKVMEGENLQDFQFPIDTLIGVEIEVFQKALSGRKDLNQEQKDELLEKFKSEKEHLNSFTVDEVKSILKSSFLPLVRQLELVEIFYKRIGGHNNTAAKETSPAAKSESEEIRSIPSRSTDLSDQENFVAEDEAQIRKEIPLGKVRNKSELVNLLKEQASIPMTPQEIKELLTNQKVVLPVVVTFQFQGQEIKVETRLERTVVLRRDKEDAQGFFCFIVIEGKPAVQGPIRISLKLQPSPKTLTPLQRFVKQGEVIATLEGEPGVDCDGKLIPPDSWIEGVKPERNFHQGVQCVFNGKIWRMAAMCTGFYEIDDYGIPSFIGETPTREVEGVEEFVGSPTSSIFKGSSILSIREPGDSRANFERLQIQAGSYVLIEGIQIEKSLKVSIGSDFKSEKTKEIRSLHLKKNYLEGKVNEGRMNLEVEVSRVGEMLKESDAELVKTVKDHTLDKDKKLLIIDNFQTRERMSKAGVMPMERQEMFRSLRRLIRFAEELEVLETRLGELEAIMKKSSMGKECTFNTTELFHPYLILRAFMTNSTVLEVECNGVTKKVVASEMCQVRRITGPKSDTEPVCLFEYHLRFNRQTGNFEVMEPVF